MSGGFYVFVLFSRFHMLFLSLECFLWSIAEFKAKMKFILAILPFPG